MKSAIFNTIGWNWLNPCHKAGSPTSYIMKKLILSFFCAATLTGSVFAQQVISSSGTSNPNIGAFDNEVKFNFLNLILLGSFEVGYERFLSENHSLDFQIHFNDRFSYHPQNDGENFKSNSVQSALNFYFGNDLNGRFHIYPFIKFRFGDYEEAVNASIVSTDMTAFILGAGLGYKWEVTDHFAFGPYASIARNFSEVVSDQFAGVEVNGGFSLGYRF